MVLPCSNVSLSFYHLKYYLPKYTSQGKDPLPSRTNKMSTPQTPTPHKLFIQMSGTPGSGKSTIAALLRQRIGGVVIDHDVLRSSLFESGIPFDQAAQHAYQLQWALAQDFIR